MPDSKSTCKIDEDTEEAEATAASEKCQDAIWQPKSPEDLQMNEMLCKAEIEDLQEIADILGKLFCNLLYLSAQCVT